LELIIIGEVIKIPESRAEAEKRAEKLGFPKSSGICLEKDNKCYIAPRGSESAAAKRAYAEARERGLSQERAAKTAHHVETQVEESRK